MIKTIASVSSTTLAANDCTRRCLNMNIVTKDTADTAVMRCVGSVLAAYNSSENPTARNGQRPENGAQEEIQCLRSLESQRRVGILMLSGANIRKYPY